MRLIQFRRILLSILFFLLYFFPSQGQEYIFNHLGKNDGLASDFVNAVWQDNRGYLWIGTDNGLQRYDGRTFFSPNNNTHTSLPFAPVHQIIADSKGRMWIRCGSQVGVFDPGTYRYQSAVIANREMSHAEEAPILKTDAVGNIYVLVKAKGIFYLDEQKFEFRVDAAPYKIPGGWKVSESFEDTLLKRSWIGYNEGLACYDWKTKQLWTTENNPLQLPLLNARLNRVVGIDIDLQRKYWVSNFNKGITFLCFDERTNSFTRDTAGLTRAGEKGYFSLNHISIFSDSVRIAYGTNVLELWVNDHFDHFENHAPANSISYEKISQVFEDKENGIWVASDQGLYNITAGSRKITRFLAPKESGMLLNAVHQLPDGDVLIANFGKNILRFDQQLRLKKGEELQSTNADINYRYIWTMETYRATNTVWIGCRYGRLMLYDISKSRLSYYNPAAFKSSTALKFVTDPSGKLWIGLSNGDLVQWSPEKGMADTAFRTINTTGIAITEMFVHADGNLYVGTRGRGVFAFSVKTGELVQQLNTSSKIKLSSDHASDICQTSDSTFIVAADMLNIVNTNTGKVQYVSKYNNELLGPLFLVAPDLYGDIWFVTTNGVYRYTPAGSLLQKFSQWDGMGASNSSLAILDRSRLSNGNILFVGNLNAMAFDPNNFRSTSKPGKVLISNLRLGNNILPLDSVLALKTLQLGRDQNSLVFSFASPQFTRQNSVFYQYKLENADEDWITAGPSMEARYSLLPPGFYRFMVRAKNDKGVMSDQVTAMDIRIYPPFWKTWWFITICVLAAILIGYQLHRMRLEQLLKVEKVRVRLAQDLHDDMGSTLSTINILSTVAMKKGGAANTDVNDQLQKISQNSVRVMEAMDDIVWSINPNNDNMKKIIARMREFAGTTLEAKDIGFSFKIDEGVNELSFSMEARRDIFLIFKECINNILKYSEANRVAIILELHKKQFIMKVVDDGKGFDPSAPMKETRGNGLRNMQMRASSMKGSYQIQSSPGKGTTVELKVPIKA